MKGQSEIMVFVLLFLLSIGLLTIAIFWGKDIFSKNVDTTRISSAEKAIEDIDHNVKSLMKLDGYVETDYNVDGIITLLNNTTIEIKTEVPSGVSVPRYWVNISSGSPFIREMLDGDMFRVQLVYPEDYYRVQFFTDGPTSAKPKKIRVEKNSTYTENNKLTIRIRITFI